MTSKQEVNNSLYESISDALADNYEISDMIVDTDDEQVVVYIHVPYEHLDLPGVDIVEMDERYCEAVSNVMTTFGYTFDNGALDSNSMDEVSEFIYYYS